jgi:ribosomal-protein-alanine N-acetyltransferase
MLVFDRPVLADQADYERLFLDPRVQRWLRPPPLPPFDRPQIHDVLRREIAHWDQHGFGLWVLRDGDTGEFVGRGGLNSCDVEGRPAIEIGWAVVPERWGQGIATAVARAAIAHARGIGMRELVAFTLPDNAASERVMQKAGMERAGPIEHAGLAHVLYRISP